MRGSEFKSQISNLKSDGAPYKFQQRLRRFALLQIPPYFPIARVPKIQRYIQQS
jgi:hypothetical protein